MKISNKHQVLSIKGSKLVIKMLVLTLSFSALYLLFNTSTAHAQTVDPTIWQTQATGMKTTVQSDKRTGGLGFILEQTNTTSWPLFKLPGGVRQGRFWGQIAKDEVINGNQGREVTIDLGNIKLPNGVVTSVSETADWAKDILNYNASALTATISRLTPAGLLQVNSNVLRLFSGNLAGWTVTLTPVASVGPRTAAPVYLKYIAYSTGGTIQVQPLSSTSLNLPPLDNNWIMVWYGTNSHFLDTKKPMYYSGGWAPYNNSTAPSGEAYQADAPIFMTFQNPPTAIVNSPEGGIDLTFATNAGNISILPIMGRDHPAASVTESWGTSRTLPASMISNINFWTPRTCQFPTSVAESYGYNSGTDTAAITDTFTYTNVCSNGISFAPIPPILALARAQLNVSLSGAVVSGNLPTSFGPIEGINNANSYTWSLAGLKKYTDNRRVVTNSGAPPADIVKMLTDYVDKMTANGHFAPWLFTDNFPNSDIPGEFYFKNPADAIYLLSEIIPALPEPQKTNALNYLKAERANYPPETVYDLSLSQGRLRSFFAAPENTGKISGATSETDLWTRIRPDQFLKRVPLYNYYALSRYYDTTKEAIPATLSTNVKTALNNDMAEQDFATFSWFKGFEQKRVAVENTNRQFDGLIGAVRLLGPIGDTSTEGLSRVLLAKAAVQRAAMAVYPRWMYSAGLTDLTGFSADWMAKQTAGSSYGFIFNYNWTTPMDDPAQVVILNQFETMLHDNSGTRNWNFDMTVGDLITFQDVVPELARFLGDFVKNDVLITMTKMEAYSPNWYQAFGEAILGAEHGLSHPTDSFQMFMAKSIIQGVTGDNLAKFLDVPYLYDGSDFFYTQKLAETVKSYQGLAWADQVVASPSPVATPSPVKVGDIDGNGRVDIFDYNQLLTDFGKQQPGLASDLDNNGRVDIFDYNLVLTNFGL